MRTAQRFLAIITLAAVATVPLTTWGRPSPASAAPDSPSVVHPLKRFPIAATREVGAGNRTDVFTIDTGGALTLAKVDGAGAWQGPAPITNRSVFPVGGAIAAGPEVGAPGRTDVFAVNIAGAMTVTWTDGAGTTWHGPTAISNASTYDFGSPVAISQQFGAANQTDVFAINAEGQLTVIWSENGGSWNGPVILSGAIFPGAGEVAVSQQFGAPNQTDVFAVNISGQLTVTWVQGAGAWSSPQVIGTGGYAFGVPVAASQQFGISNQTDVFGVSAAGNLTNAWVAGTGPWHGPGNLAATTLPSDTVLAVSQQFGAANTTDVFGIDQTGRLTVTWVQAAGPWFGPTPIGQPGALPTGTGVAASQQFGLDQIDVFAVNAEGTLTVTWAGATGVWNGPQAI
ncbi:hypothetical protein [Rugosimonospora africana]|uniref:Uncharacterized protein n=1 Tax=Rugosimonospora africana TaxID=556532 RepID=A0A8J3R007_9ACTN|nr:hypothetical protein [Rugosimonospora africana]GIH20464.1 hypothetical protein Raf01_86360 [Rugosimonospora africana]